jgi:hypothetical protein
MDPKTNSMYEILSKLQSANPKSMNEKVEIASSDLIEAASKNVDLKVAMTSKIDESSVTVQNYRIDIVLQEFAGKQKRFYNVVDGDKIIHRELGLFETAMGIVKNLMLGKSSRVQELVTHDNSYMDNLYEVYMHNTRIKRGTVNEDVAVAKLSKAKSKVAEAKSKILKRL